MPNAGRGDFGTKTGRDGSHVWTANDRAFFVFRHDFFPLTHDSFEALESAAASATVRLEPASAWVSADIADVYSNSTNPNGLTTEKRFHTVYAYATKTGLSDSAVVTWNFP